MPGAAVIAGATGLVGAACLERLLDSGSFERVIALVRRPTGREHALYEERVLDFHALDGVDIPAGSDIFCALGTTIRAAGSQEAFRRVDHDYPLALARRAAACGARQYLIVTSAGAGESKSNFYLRTKGDVEQAVSAIPFDAVHIFRPGPLIGERQERRIGERIGIAAARALTLALAGPLRKYRAIAAADVAGAMLAAALQGTAGRHIYHYDEILALARRQ